MSGKQSSLNLSIFVLFLFVEMFQSSLNCESSLKLFSAEFSVEFSFSSLTWKNFICRISFHFTFISQEAPFKNHLSKHFCWFKFFVPSVWSPNSYRGFNSSSGQKNGRSYLVPCCLRLLLPFPLWSNQVCTWSVWFFLWSIFFLKFLCTTQLSLLITFFYLPKYFQTLGFPWLHVSLKI